MKKGVRGDVEDRAPISYGFFELVGARLVFLCCCCCKEKPCYKRRVRKQAIFQRARQLLYAEQDFINMI